MLPPMSDTKYTHMHPIHGETGKWQTHCLNCLSSFGAETYADTVGKLIGPRTCNLDSSILNLGGRSQCDILQLFA